MIRALGLAAALALLAPSSARAGTCGGNSDGGGGSSGGGGSDSGSSDSIDIDSGSGSSAPACSDATDVVGYRTCVPFGAWANRQRLPTLFAEVGTGYRTFASPLGDATGHLEHDSESFSYRATSAPPAAAPTGEAALVSSFRVGVGLPRGLYAAAELELGGLTRNASRAEMTTAGTRGTPTITPTTAILAGGAAILGVRGGAGRASFAAELAGGARSITYGYQSRYGACEAYSTLGVATGIAEARARASYWLSPFVNLGATAGASLVERGAWMAGVHLGFASHAFGGR